MRSVYRTCPICDAVCGLRIALDAGGRVASITGDESDPLSGGFICPKGASLGRLDEDPDRLDMPLVRKGTTWQQVTWPEAFEAVDQGLRKVIDAHGRQSLAAYFGNPTFHTMAGFMYRQPLSQALGTPNLFSVSTVDQMPKHVSCGLMFGDPMAIPVPDLDRTQHLLVIGANPVDSQGSLCAAPNFARRLKDLRARGGKLVVVDPRRTRTAGLADEHQFIRPGTDAVLLFGIVRVLFAENRTTLRVATNGLEELRRLANEFTPEKVSQATGIPTASILRMARDLTIASTAVVYTRVGTCTSEFGTLTQWLVDVINILTGNLDKPGGAMFTRTAGAEVFRTGAPFSTGRWHSRVRGLPEVLGEFPVATLADEIETPGDGQVRALITVAGNPALSAPNGPRLEQMLPDLEFMVSVDPYRNETTEHADVILPPPRILQTPHYDFLLQTVTVRNYTRFSPAVMALEPGRPSEAEIMARLVAIASCQGPEVDPATFDRTIIEAMLGSAAASNVQSMALDGDNGPEQLLDGMLKLGPYGLSLEALKANPNGIDLGALEPRLTELVCTTSGRVELVPRELRTDIAKLSARLAEPAARTVLIGRRQRRSNNSWMHNVPTLVGGSNQCTLHIHPDDVREFGLGERALIRSEAGTLVARLEPTETIMPGVVSLPHGWGHTSAAQRIAVQHAGVNANTLTSEKVIDAPSGNAVFNGVPVTLEPCSDLISSDRED